MAIPERAEPEAPVAVRVAEAVEAWARRCLESGRPPSEELDEATDLDSLDPEERAFLVRVGAIAATNDQLHRWRGEDAETEGGSSRSRTNPMHAARGRNPTFWRALGITLAGADGVLKSLLAFNAADLGHLRQDAEAQRIAWTRRRAWAEAADCQRLTYAELTA